MRGLEENSVPNLERRYPTFERTGFTRKSGEIKKIRHLLVDPLQALLNL
jgi:hypothetical protein